MKETQWMYGFRRLAGEMFVVAIREPDNTPLTRIFVVQVKGTLSSDQTDWTENVKQLYQKGGGPFYLPACVFVVDVRRNDAAVYAWVAEPQVRNNSVALNFCPEFHELNEEAVDQIVTRVREWYDSMPHSMSSQAS